MWQSPSWMQQGFRLATDQVELYTDMQHSILLFYYYYFLFPLSCKTTLPSYPTTSPLLISWIMQALIEHHTFSGNSLIPLQVSSCTTCFYAVLLLIYYYILYFISPLKITEMRRKRIHEEVKFSGWTENIHCAGWLMGQVTIELYWEYHGGVVVSSYSQLKFQSTILLPER